MNGGAVDNFARLTKLSLLRRGANRSLPTVAHLITFYLQLRNRDVNALSCLWKFADTALRRDRRFPNLPNIPARLQHKNRATRLKNALAVGGPGNLVIPN